MALSAPHRTGAKRLPGGQSEVIGTSNTEFDRYDNNKRGYTEMNAIKKVAIVLTMASSTLVAAGPAMAAPATHTAAATVSASAVTSDHTSEIPPCVGCW